MPLAAGSRLGPYEILSPIGAGGMGEVYHAHDPRLGRDVAIKIVTDVDGTAEGSPASPGSRADRRRRFEQEARMVAALSHPNVLAIFDVGAGEPPYLVTELLNGQTLRALVDRGPIPPRRALDLGLQLVAGLAAAHARGIVHRDLKPDNIFVTADGRVKILDFGLARHLAIGQGDESVTRARTTPGVVLGTVGYMAPEQVRGLDSDHRADVFAVGAVLFEMLTGTRAFRGESSADTISAILSDPPSALVFASDTPPALSAIVRRCLAKHVNERFQSARELGAAIESSSDLGSAPMHAIGSRELTSVAVLPFINLSADPENQYFSEGLAEDLINALTRLAGLRVASRTSSFRYRGHDLDIREIGRELGVGAILEGSVRRAGSRLRVTTQLTSAADGYHMWSGRYDRELTDVFDIQDQVVEAIVHAIAPSLVAEARTVVRRPTENLQAYELCLKGRHFWNQRSPAVVGTAIRCFEEAIALDPSYALAYTGLADCYSILRVYGWMPPEHSQPRALDAVTRALALDPGLPDALLSKALYTFHFEREWRSARRQFEEALAASPRAGLFEANFALFLATEYSYDEAREHIERAIALDPHSSLVYFQAAAVACLMGDVEAVARHAARSLELQPESLGARWPQTVGLLIAGRVAEALAVGEQVTARTRAPIYLGVHGLIYGRAGRLDAARRIRDELEERLGRGEYVVPSARLSVQLGLGDVPGIRAALAACVDGGAAPLSVASTSRHFLDGHRHDPEIDRLLDRLHDGARPPAASTGPGGPIA